MHMTEPSQRAHQHRYLGRPDPLFFPVEEEVPESLWHLAIRMVLFESLREAFGERAAVGSDQFVYWDAADPSKCCAPDVFVRVGEPHASFACWKTWEGGTPQLAVEIASDSDAPAQAWADKLRRYRGLGVKELVRFDPDHPDRPLRIWDRVQEDLVERDPSDPALRRCETLGAYWLVVQGKETVHSLRLSCDAEGASLYLTPLEKQTEARARAEERVHELEAELAKRDRR
jgi:hypothetical protein